MRRSILIISTGTELAGGRSRDSNGPEIAERFVELGYPVLGLRIVPDDPALLSEELERAVADKRVAAVILTGGLGPTADDHTVDVLARLSGLEIVEDADALRKMELLSRRWKRRFDVTAARRQARVLAGSRILRNDRGLAPGMSIAVPVGSEVCIVAAMPGVPEEMRLMFEAQLLPFVEESIPSQKLAREVFYLYGVGESTFQGAFFGRPNRTDSDPPPLVERARLPEAFSWGVTAARGSIKVFFEAEDRSALADLRQIAADAFPAEFIARPVHEELHDYFLASGGTLALAESCTGGWIAKLLTDQPGTSAYFLGGVVSYANSAKEQLLGVSGELLAAHGAVSEESAIAMARGALSAFGSQVALSVTGIAGPSGGTPEKPVGTVYTAAATPKGVSCIRLDLPMDRDRVREYSANLALFHLYRTLRSAE